MKKFSTDEWKKTALNDFWNICMTAQWGKLQPSASFSSPWTLSTLCGNCPYQKLLSLLHIFWGCFCSFLETQCIRPWLCSLFTLMSEVLCIVMSSQDRSDVWLFCGRNRQQVQKLALQIRLRKVKIPHSKTFRLSLFMLLLDLKSDHLSVGTLNLATDDVVAVCWCAVIVNSTLYFELVVLVAVLIYAYVCVTVTFSLIRSKIRNNITDFH